MWTVRWLHFCFFFPSNRECCRTGSRVSQCGDIWNVWPSLLYRHIPSHSSFSLSLSSSWNIDMGWLTGLMSLYRLCTRACGNVRVCVARMRARVEWCSVSSMWCEYWPRPVLCSDWLLSLSCHLWLSFSDFLSLLFRADPFMVEVLMNWSVFCHLFSRCNQCTSECQADIVLMNERCGRLSEGGDWGIRLNMIKIWPVL